MTPPDDHRTGRRPGQQTQGQGGPPARSRRAPLFPLEADDIDPRERRLPPAPLGDLLGDLDEVMPSRAAPPRRSTPPRPEAPQGRSPADTKPLRDVPAPRSQSTPRREPAPPQPPRPVTTEERAPRSQPRIREVPVEPLVERRVAPLREALDDFHESATDIARAERYSARQLGYGGYLSPAPPASSLNQFVWMAAVAIVSLVIIVTLGVGGDSSAFSRWVPFLNTSGETVESRTTLFSGVARPAGDYNLKAPPSISAEQIDAILASYGSPAAGTGAVWYNLGLKYGIDPAFAVAFFIHESGAGTAQAWAGLKPDGSTTHNVGNIICAGYSTCYGRFRDYPSWEHGIEDWYRLIDVEYLQGRGHRTVADIIPVYAPSFENDVNGYVNVVQRLVDQWRTQGVP